MPVTISFKSDGVLEQVAANMAAAPDWMPKIIRDAMDGLGKEITQVMQQQLEPHRYTGELSDSVTHELGDQEVRIEPRAMRGRWDAGSLLEGGSRPHFAPFAPIAAYAGTTGVPAGALWMAIATRGTKGHPFLQATLDNSKGAMDNAAEKIVVNGAQAVFSGVPKGDIVG